MTPSHGGVALACLPTVDRLCATMPEEVGSAAREAATRAGVSVSSWLTAAARRRLRGELLRSLLDGREAEDGPLTEDERRAAAAKLGLACHPRACAAPSSTQER